MTRPWSQGNTKTGVVFYVTNNAASTVYVTMEPQRCCLERDTSTFTDTGCDRIAVEEPAQRKQVASGDLAGFQFIVRGSSAFTDTSFCEFRASTNDGTTDALEVTLRSIGAWLTALPDDSPPMPRRALSPPPSPATCATADLDPAAGCTGSDEHCLALYGQAKPVYNTVQQLCVRSDATTGPLLGAPTGGQRAASSPPPPPLDCGEHGELNIDGECVCFVGWRTPSATGGTGGDIFAAAAGDAPPQAPCSESTAPPPPPPPAETRSAWNPADNDATSILVLVCVVLLFMCICCQGHRCYRWLWGTERARQRRNSRHNSEIREQRRRRRRSSLDGMPMINQPTQPTAGEARVVATPAPAEDPAMEWQANPAAKVGGDKGYAIHGDVEETVINPARAPPRPSDESATSEQRSRRPSLKGFFSWMSRRSSEGSHASVRRSDGSASSSGSDSGHTRQYSPPPPPPPPSLKAKGSATSSPPPPPPPPPPLLKPTGKFAQQIEARAKAMETSWKTEKQAAPCNRT